MSIIVKNLNYKYDISGFEVKANRLEIKKGELVAIVGPSGSGKTTLLYCLSGIIPHCVKRGELKGMILIDGKDITKISLKEIIGKIGVVLQTPESQIFGMSVEEDIAFALENIGLKREIIKERIEKWLNRLEMIEFKKDDPESLSGGQKQRLVIASSLAMEPEFIFFDEPFSNLDVKATKILVKIFEELKRKGKTIIIVERNIKNFIHLVDKIIVIENGKITSILGKDDTEKLTQMGFLWT